MQNEDWQKIIKNHKKNTGAITGAITAETYEGEQRRTAHPARFVKTAWGSLKYDEIIQTSLSTRQQSVYSVGVKSASTDM